MVRNQFITLVCLATLHPRCATICGLRAAVKIVREKNLVPGAVVGRRQLAEATGVLA